MRTLAIALTVALAGAAAPVGAVEAVAGAGAAVAVAGDPAALEPAPVGEGFGVDTYEIDVGFATVAHLQDALPLAGAMALLGPQVAPAFAPVVDASSFLGEPTSAVATLVDGGRFQRFAGGVVVAWEKEPLAIPATIAHSYVNAGGPAGPLGRPQAAPVSARGGMWQEFAAGAVFAQDNQAIVVAEPIWTALATLSGDRLAYGFPQAGAESTPAGVGQRFAHALVWVGAGAGPIAVTGAYASAYQAAGGLTGALGPPLAASDTTGGVTSQRFTSGALYGTDPVFAVSGAAYDAYQAAGGVTGPLGLPTGAVSTVPGGLAQAFSGGGIYTSGEAAFAVTGAVFERYQAAGGPTGALGLPQAAAQQADGVVVQTFAGGTLQDPPPWSPPAGYLGPVAQLPALTGGIPITAGWNGTRVNLLQNLLGIGRFETHQTYDAATQAAVRSWQSSHGLAVTGVVNAATWASFKTGQPFTIDAWRPDVQVGLTATRSQRIEAMIGFAVSQLGAKYSWGGAGPYQMGYDCSGIVLAALNAAGLDLPGIDPLKHAEPEFRTTSALYHHSQLQHVPLAERTRGDIILWVNSRGGFVHAAIYLGDGKLIESTKTDVHYNTYSPRLYNLHVKPTVVRPFP